METINKTKYIYSFKECPLRYLYYYAHILFPYFACTTNIRFDHTECITSAFLDPSGTTSNTVDKLLKKNTKKQDINNVTLISFHTKHSVSKINAAIALFASVWLTHVPCYYRRSTNYWGFFLICVSGFQSGLAEVVTKYLL